LRLGARAAQTDVPKGSCGNQCVAPNDIGVAIASHHDLIVGGSAYDKVRQLEAVACDVTDGLEWKRAEHALDLGNGRSRIIGLH